MQQRGVSKYAKNLFSGKINTWVIMIDASDVLRQTRRSDNIIEIIILQKYKKGMTIMHCRTDTVQYADIFIHSNEKTGIVREGDVSIIGEL